MSKKNQYEVKKFYGLPVENDRSGNWQLRSDGHGQAKIHSWRIGKHTRGKFVRPGQLLLTENNLTVMIIRAEPMAFKNRHSEVPCQRLLTQFADDALLKQGQQILAAEETANN